VVYDCLDEFRAKKKFVRHAAIFELNFERNVNAQFLSRIKGYRFEISATLRQLGRIDAPHTQNLEILTSLEQTQE
jgi:hypothetical protein